MYIYFIFVQTSYIAKDIDVGATLGFGSISIIASSYIDDRTNSQISIRT